ncbi:MAG: type II restriction endonuclease [Bacteroidia bacterium]|nr:MAG: type II restriction endonuclease [Bacteroidia bacterium]
MKLEIIKLDKAINKAYFKQSLKRADIELFKDNFKSLFERINHEESEEHNKNIISDFLKNTFYKNRYEINTSGRKDLVIHKGTTSQTAVSVIIEAKSPTNKAEMISRDKPNAKALHEAVHYYLHERIKNQNKDLKHLIITNIYEWFIFDSVDFENYFYENKEFRKKYEEWADKELAGTKTDWFYSELAKPYIDREIETLKCVHINLLHYEELVKNETEDNKLINLYKILSPEHLLKLPFANDYNKIDIGFYNELLHILGLEETKKSGKKQITRIKPKNRKAGSLLENTINIIQSKHRLEHIEKPNLFGNTEEEQIFSIALELVITWLNRVLFLKLLEAQLIKYHKGDKNYEFININKIKDFDELDELFFDVLAKRPEKRSNAVNQKFGNLPYLNSSLFEITKLEDKILFISSLKDRLTLEVSKQTVLKDKQGKRLKGKLNTLEYLFNFLNAYSFSSDDKAEIQNDNRTIINAAVLGLIFEKINGYKDGSFYTPSFITSYMSREVIRNTVVDKFNETYKKQFQNFEQLKDFIDFSDEEERQKANEIINSVKICDPAVGSGHFLVSVLNELVAVKSELKILSDAAGKRLRGIKIENHNDELEIIDEETSEPFQYFVNEKGNPPSEIQNVQKAIFNEKRNLIENCIYGVDINPKSVLICRLRLWIELLKNTFYTEESNFKFLETLPNIDINIKTGNSLISKFDTGLNIFEQKAVNHLITQYKFITDQYKGVTDYEQKQSLREQISRLKTELGKYAIPRDKYYRKYLKKKDELGKLLNVNSTSKEVVKKISELSEEVAKLEGRYKDNYNNVYANSLEWSVEFPEILTDEGKFRGFDIVIGNPPYFSISKEPKLKEVNENYTIFKNTADIYTLFVERGMQILKNKGKLCMITSNKWLRSAYGENLREYLLENTTIDKIIDFDGLKVFDEATVDTGIIELRKQKNGKKINTVRFDKTFNVEKDDIGKYFEKHKIELSGLTKESWNFVSEREKAIRTKLEKKGKALESWNININRGITTGLNEAFVIDTKTKNRLIKSDKSSEKLIKPLLRGRDIKKYNVDFSDLWIISTFPALNIEIENYKILKSHLSKFKTRLKSKPQNYKGNWSGRKTGNFEWFEIQDNTAYYPEFQKEKIIFTKASQTKSFAYDDKGYYLQNTSYILTGENLKYLLGILNSKLITYAFINFYQSGGIEGEITVQAMNKIPIPEITPANKELVSKIEILVNEILEVKETDSQVDISKQETAINKLVYQLYDLTSEEIEMIEKE